MTSTTASIKRDGRQKPSRLEINSANIPESLKALPRWLGWRWEWDAKAEKWNKPPIDIRRDRRGSSTDAATWCDFDTALKAAESGFVDGIGFALGDGFCGIDFDNCRDRVTGAIAPEVAIHIAKLATYAEVSPSGEGVKLIVQGVLPEGRRACGTVEMYDKGRYFTITGHRLEGCACEPVSNDAALRELHAVLLGAERNASESRAASRLDDRDLALAALGGLSPSRADGYHEWVLVGMALKATDDSLLDAWDQWSQASAKYTPGACAEKWRSFNGSTVSLGSLIYWAKQDGWEPPKRPTKAKKSRSWESAAERATGGDSRKFVPRPSTDLGNAERFVAQHSRAVRYVVSWGKWIVWDGTRFKVDSTNQVWRLGKRTVRSIYAEVAQLAKAPDTAPDDLQELSDWAKASERRERIAAMLALAATEDPIAIDHEALDRDPWLLNCTNGTLDLRTGELRPHRQEDLLTKSTGVEYPAEPGIDTPVWDDFLDSTFLSDVELIRFIQRLLGYSAAGVIHEHILPICWGSGANGKSTLLNTVLDTLGEYAYQAPHNFLMVKRGETHPTELTDLFGARIVSISETQDGQRLDEGLVKALTGSEKIRARRMYQDFWEFPPTHTPILATNHRPVIRGGDHAIWRRVKLIPFVAKFVDPHEDDGKPGTMRKDKQLPEKLKSERGGILRWIVQGCLDWRRQGLDPPEAVRAATQAYKDESDTFKSWLDDRCDIAPNLSCKASAAYADYRRWSEEACERPLSKNKFAAKVDDSGFHRERTRIGVLYGGFTPRNCE